MNASSLGRALEKGAAGQRLSREEAILLAQLQSPSEIHQLGQAALTNRRARFGNRATYVFSLHVNPSNICQGGCRFCRFAARPGDEQAYVLDEDTILQAVAATEPTEVHLVGGLNDYWPWERSLALVRELRQRHSALHLKAFTAVEIDFFAQRTGQSTEQILVRLQEAGLDALPGGGAELFSTRVRQQVCPEKLSAGRWLEIHAQAHRLGLSTNATMLYGLGETPEERVDHLLALRETQDRSGGFSCFIPLAFQKSDSAGSLGRPSPLVNLAVVALARLLLDNFPHVKAYWPMIGLETASAALSWGADDLDGTLGQERIAHAAGAPTPKALTRTQMQRTIELGGFRAVERDGRFEELAR